MMTGPELARIIEGALPEERIEEAARRLKVVERQSKLQMKELVLALVLSARTSAGGRLAEALRLYLDRLQMPRIARSTFYERFDSEFEKLMEELLSAALQQARDDEVLLPKSLACVSDWYAVDSTTVKLNDALVAEYPGTGDFAALKVHKTFSIGRNNVVDYTFTPARQHDGPQLVLDESWRGRGLVVDLGYASHKLLVDARRHGVELVLKLKKGWKARVTRVARGQFIEGKRRDYRRYDVWWSLGDYRLRSKDDVVDCDVEIDVDGAPVPMRFVALYVNGTAVYFLTTLDRRKVPAELVGQLYRLRWNIEMDNKLNKSDWVLDEIDATRPPAVRALLLSSLLGSVIVNRIVHADHRNRAAAKQPPRHGPMHARLVALTLATAASRIAGVLADNTSQPAHWDHLANSLDALARDPNWRRRPSVLDQLLGFTAPPGRPRREKATQNMSENDL